MIKVAHSTEMQLLARGRQEKEKQEKLWAWKTFFSSFYENVIRLLRVLCSVWVLFSTLVNC
jgi:hypothetical protein